MVGFSDSIAKKKPVGRKNKVSPWDIKPQVLKDNIDERPEQPQQAPATSEKSPLRRIIQVAEEIKEAEEKQEKSAEEFDDLSKIADKAKDIDNDKKNQQKLKTKGEPPKKTATDLSPNNKVQVKINESEKEKSPESISKIQDSLKVREYINNFQQSLKDIKQKLMLSENELLVINNEIHDYEEFINSEHERSKKLYDMYQYLKEQSEQYDANEHTESIIKSEIEDINKSTEQLKEICGVMEQESDILEIKVKEAQNNLRNKKQQLKKLELKSKNQNRVEEIEKREMLIIIEENRKLEDNIFKLKMEYKKEKQKNNSLKARSHQLQQTLNDLQNILGT